REARAAAMIRHPQICPIYDVGEHNGQAFVVMAYLEGRSLAQYMEQGGLSLDPSHVVSLTRRILDPLQTIHDMGIIHRDLKPSNIMLDNSGQPIVMDFGLAWLLGITEHYTSDGVIVGTPAYMAPEQ